MSNTFYLIIAIAVIAIVTLLTRAVPFLIFGKRELPQLIKYMGNVLPPAIMIILNFVNNCNYYTSNEFRKPAR